MSHRRTRGEPGSQRERGSRPEPGDRDALVTKRVHPALIVLAVAGCLHLFYIIGVELDRNLVGRRAVARLESEVSALTNELNRLDQVAGHGADVAYREALARQQGYVYPDERLVVTAGQDR